MKDNPKLDAKFYLYKVLWNLVSVKKIEYFFMKWYCPGIGVKFFLRPLRQAVNQFQGYLQRTAFQNASHYLID